MHTLKDLRTKANISQVELAEKIGVTQSAVAMWETGEAIPRADKLPVLAEILGCSISDLFKEG